jgi:hypothetical protein
MFIVLSSSAIVFFLGNTLKYNIYSLQQLSLAKQ